jgi:hypothetical protein
MSRRFVIRGCTLAFANSVVASRHRHSSPVVGHIFSLSLWQADNCVGVAIVGRPVSRHLAARGYLEVTRCCTDGTPHACSALYGACWRTVRRMGKLLCTYTLVTEPGTSLRAAGWRPTHLTRAEQWSRTARPRPARPLIRKIRWEPTFYDD